MLLLAPDIRLGARGRGTACTAYQDRAESISPRVHEKFTAAEMEGLLHDAGGNPRTYERDLAKHMALPAFQERVDAALGAGSATQSGRYIKSDLVATLEQLVCPPSDISFAAACRIAIEKHDDAVTSC